MERPAIITTSRAARAALGCAAILLCACESTTGPAPLIQQKAVILEAVTPLSVDGDVGTDVTPTPVVRLRYEDGTVARGVEVSFTATGSGTMARGSDVTDSDGRASPGAWALGTTAGIQTLTARARGGSLIFTAHVRAGPVAALRVTGGNYQSAAAGATLAEPLRVRALDRFDNPVAGAAVTFVVVDGGGAIAADTVFTDGLGNATSQPWTLGPIAGEQRVRAQSGNLRFVFSAAACEPVLCSRLAYVSDYAIFTLDGHTGLVQRLTSSYYDNQPAWSPDGTRIAFTRYTSDYWLAADIWVMNANGAELTRVTTGSGFSSPSWSPDGDALVFSGVGCVYYCDIYVQSLAEGSAPRHLATSAADPAWSPDGSRIAFVALSGDDGYHSLRLVEPDGSGIVEVTPIDEGAINGPSWSPDGTRIAFSKCMGGGCDIHTVHADGSQLTRLTDVGNASSPAWSADGTRIAFTILSAGVPSIALVSAAGGAVTTLIASAHSPAWRP